MKERVACGSWPANAVDDISEARKILQDGGHGNLDFTLVAHHKVLNILKNQILGTAFTYESWLAKHGLLYDTVMDDTLPINVAYLYASKKNFPVLYDASEVQIVQQNSVIKIWNIYDDWSDDVQSFDKNNE